VIFFLKEDRDSNSVGRKGINGLNECSYSDV
jgi:hypothetical protein